MLGRLVPVLWLVVGCAAALPPQPVTPTATPAAPPEQPTAETKPAQKPVVPAAVPPPPESCAVYTAHPVTGCAPTAPIRDALALALTPTAPEERDGKLACLEVAPELPPGTVRALRAELAPEECGDALVTPLLETPPKGMPREIESAMLGAVVSARLARLLSNPPAPQAPVTKDSFRTFFAETLTPWVLSQAAAIEKLSLDGSRLTGYGRGVAAIAAGNADLRFVEMVRDVTLPDEMKADKDVRDAYYGALDGALEPRKVRGRDAALVGLRAFAELGAFYDPRVTRARTLLAKLWSGSRVDALDRLLLPELSPVDTSAPNLVLAARLPTFYSGYLLRDLDPNEPKLLRALMQNGVAQPLRDKLEKSELAEPVRLLYGRALVESGRRFFRASDFKRAYALLADSKSDDTARLLAAVSQALASGPEDAAELMLKGPFVKGTGDVSGLDAEAAKKGRFAGFAAFDAAYVLELAPKPDDAAYWDELANRFTAAEKLLKPKGQSKDAALPSLRAHGYAEAARATAAALRSKK